MSDPIGDIMASYHPIGDTPAAKEHEDQLREAVTQHLAARSEATTVCPTCGGSGRVKEGGTS